MIEELPEGWANCKVGEVAESIQSGFACGAHNSDGRGTIHLRPMNVTADGRISLEDVRYVDGEIPHQVQVGDVLFNNTNSAELVGKTALIRESSSFGFSNHMTRIRCSPAVDPAFLATQLNTMFLCGYFQTRCNNHVSQASISAKFLSNEVDVVIPPLAEQRRIVAKIEELTARSRAARAALAEVPTLLEQFRQSVLASAFRGDLTADWRAKHPHTEPASELLARIRTERRKQWEAKYPKKKYVEPDPIDDSDLPELPEGWEWATAEEIVEPGAEIVYGIVQPGPVIADGVPYVRGCDIQDGVILVDQLLRTSREIADRYERASLQGGDVLLGIIRATKVAVVPDVLAGANITQGTARFRPSSAITTLYLAGWLDTPFAQNWLHEQYRGIDMPGLNLRDVRRLPVPLAPMKEQCHATKILEALFRRHQAISLAYSEGSQDLDRIDQSILAKAFRGELVPQDPADEPASVLLERLRASQSESNGSLRRKSRK